MVVVHGSGPLTREHVRGDVRSLVANGFAVLHYDKRGAGSSQGEYMPSSSNPMTRIVDVLAGDAETMMTFLHQRFEKDGIDLGFFGASQAGWIIPIAVTKCREISSFVIIISGTPASTGLEGHYSNLTGDGAGQSHEGLVISSGKTGQNGFEGVRVPAADFAFCAETHFRQRSVLL